MKQVALEACKTDDERAEVRDMTVEKMEDMGLLCKVGRDYAPTHAFHLMTDNKMKHAKIQCALFKGIDRDVFIDRKEFKGPIYTQINEAYQFVLRHINMGAEIGGIVRRDVYELPVRAIREAIVNAVTHRSYMDDSCIQISMYDDRVEVTQQQLADQLGYSKARVRKNMKILQENGVVYRKGSTKNGSWVVALNGKKKGDFHGKE